MKLPKVIAGFLGTCLMLPMFSGIPAWAGSLNDSEARFDLARWKTGVRVKTSDFSGEIIVLDFFAYWCEPCRLASRDLEQGIQKYYAARGGNPSGIKVRVLSVNIEDAKPELTDKYIHDVGAEFVVNDPDASFLSSIGGSGTPYIMVIDCTGLSVSNTSAVVAYKYEGFEGTGMIRQVIDRIGKPQSGESRPKPKPADGSSSPVGSKPDYKTTAREPYSGSPVIQQAEINYDTLFSDDIRVSNEGIRYGIKKGGTEFKINYNHITFDEDYRPNADFDFLGSAKKVQQHNNGGSITLKQKLAPRWELSGTAGGYQGFTDYRSAWFATYYRQQNKENPYFTEAIPGYEDPDPKGFNLAGNLRWEYQPSTGFIEAGFYYGRDQIAPGYENLVNSYGVEPSRRVLETYSPTVKFENVLTSRIRVQNEFQLTRTSSRRPRYQYRGQLNLALAESWVVRLSGGLTRETPALKAQFFNGTLEYEFARNWLLSGTGGIYEDTGEIENSLQISTAAPGVKVIRAGGGVKYAGRIFSFSLSAAPVWTTYAPVSIGTQPFANLYRSRDWISVQAAVSCHF